MPIFVAQDFHDIAPPVNYSLLPPWLIVCAAFLGVTLVGLVVWLFVRRRQQPSTTIRSARDEAIERLERARLEIDKTTAYRFSIRVSDILRGYVTRQYQLPVTRQTSVEFLNAMAKARQFSEDEKSLLTDFLNRCDLIKFARYEATTGDSHLLLEEAFRLVRGGQLAPA